MFTNASLRRLIVPLVFEQMLVMLVGIADTVMVSFAGEAAISGVALVDMLNYLVITVMAAIATGGAVIVSQYLGSRDRERASLAASQLLTITLLLSTAVTALCLPLNKPILRLLFGAVTADVMQAAVTYFGITALSFPFLGMYNAAAAVFRAMGKTKVTMYVSLMMNVINVLGNAIGIFVLHAGVAGVAVPTLLSRAAAAVVLTCLSLNRKNEAAVRWREIVAFHSEIIRKILRIAVPNGIENGLFALGRVLVTSIVTLFGTSHVAANGVAGSVDMIAIIVVNSVNLAIVTVVGRCVGAREYGQAGENIKKLMRISYVSTACLALIVWAVLPTLLSLYNLSGETYRLSYMLIMLHNIAAAALHPTSFNLPNALRAAGDAKFTMYAGISSMIVFRLLSAAFFGIVLDLGVTGVWIAMCTDWLCRSVLFAIRYKRGGWRGCRAI